MKLKTIGILLLIAALIGGSVGVVAAEQADEGPNCDDCTVLSTNDNSLMVKDVRGHPQNMHELVQIPNLFKVLVSEH